jgi:hypothetical protein
MTASPPGTAAGRERLVVLGAIGEPIDGVGYVRFVVPFTHLRDDGIELRTLGRTLQLKRGPAGYEPDPALLRGASLVVLPQLVASPVLPDGSRVELVRALCRHAAGCGIPVVYSVDDYLPSLEETSAAYERVHGSLHNLDVIREHAQAIIATTEPLRESLAVWGRPIHVLPNVVDPGRWRARPCRSGELRIGWAGSSSHLEDLLMVIPAIRELQRRRACRLMILGLTDLALDEQAEQIRRQRPGLSPAQLRRAECFQELLGSLRELQYKHIPFQPLSAYFDLLPALDLEIGICPLLDTPFNRHKSALKFYEYAVTGSLTVASCVPPYAGEVSITVPNEAKAWCDVLERFLWDEPARHRELERQRSFVLGERSILGWKGRWAAVLRSILSGRATPVAVASTR